MTERRRRIVPARAVDEPTKASAAVAPPRLKVVRELAADPHGRRLVVEVLEHDDGERVARVRSRGAPLSPSIVVRRRTLDALIAALTEARAQLERTP